MPDKPWHYYHTSGQQRREYEVFGLLMPSEDERHLHWTSMRESQLERVLGVQRDEEFSPGRFTDVVPYPYE